MVSSLGQLISPNSSGNQVDSAGLPSGIQQAIRNAASRTGVDFTYLLKKAQQESGLNTNAQASGSSATGLYQFTSQTWLRMIKNYGAQYGLSSSAASIKIDSDGVAHVGDPETKQAILAMRKDPQISAEMAGELDKENAGSLQSNVGGKIGATELYLAHFLGAGGASDFLNTMRATPNAKAANILPDAAASNPSVFYNRSGQPLSLKQIYQHFAQKFDGASSGTMIATAAAEPTTSTDQTAAAIYTSAKNYTIADAGITLPPSGTMLSSLGQLKASGNSLVATMIMAQMNLGEIDNSSSMGMAALSTQHKKDVLDALSATA